MGALPRHHERCHRGQRESEAACAGKGYCGHDDRMRGGVVGCSGMDRSLMDIVHEEEGERRMWCRGDASVNRELVMLGPPSLSLLRMNEPARCYFDDKVRCHQWVLDSESSR